MDMFEKATKVAKNLGSNIYNTTKDQSELASLNVQKSLVEKKLHDSYAIIGERYVDYVSKCDTGVVFNVDDVLELIQPELEKLSNIKAQILEKNEQIKSASEEKAYKKAEEEFANEKARLDKALAMDIITTAEYYTKLDIAQMKLNNYDLIKKIDAQYEMGIITKEEHDEKINRLLK